MILPNNVDNNEIKIKIFMFLINVNINSGAIFCQVKIKNKINHVICLVILGNQKCNGAPPNFKIKDISNIVDKNLWLNIEYQDIL